MSPRSMCSYLVLALILCGGLAGSQQTKPAAQLSTDQLTKEEVSISKELADRAIKEKRLETVGPLYFIQAELFRDKPLEENVIPDRKALVTHYRYDGDLTILTVVTLQDRKVEETRTIAHLPTPLSQEEFNLAKQLALENSEVRKQLGAMSEKVVIGPLVIRTMNREDPWFGHRVVRLLFRVGPDYLSEPIVIVDLTEKKVIVDQKAKPEEE